MAKKLFYSMGEVSEMFDVNASLIRFWETKFDILRPQKNKKGNRLFSPADVENLKLIYHLVKERGMTLDGAARCLKQNKGTIRAMRSCSNVFSVSGPCSKRCGPNSRRVRRTGRLSRKTGLERRPKYRRSRFVPGRSLPRRSWRTMPEGMERRVKDLCR